MHAAWATGHEKVAVLLDHSSCDDDHRRALVGRHARGPGVSGASARNKQAVRIGQVGHLGFRAVQRVAPKSISAWLKSKTWRIGRTMREIAQRWRRIACAFGSPRPTKIRNNTRATFVSRMAARWPKAKLKTAPAVYSPMPLNDRSVASSRGSSPPYRSTDSRAIACSRRGRTL